MTWFVGILAAALNHDCPNCNLVFNACEWIIMTLIQSFIFTFYLDWGDLEIVFKFHENKNPKLDKQETAIYIGMECPEF